MAQDAELEEPNAQVQGLSFTMATKRFLNTPLVSEGNLIHTMANHWL
jgi:hypothetical protein